MQQVRIEKTKLLDALKENRQNHRKIFDEAQTNYRTQVITELDAMLTEAKAGKRIRRSVSLVEPIDQTREYDRAIKMLEMSTDSIIELAEYEFNCLVLDQWNWRGQFLASNMMYSKTAEEMYSKTAEDIVAATA